MLSWGCRVQQKGGIGAGRCAELGLKVGLILQLLGWPVLSLLPTKQDPGPSRSRLRAVFRKDASWGLRSPGPLHILLYGTHRIDRETLQGGEGAA